MTVIISEVLKRSEQGVTRPFICRGDDELIYFVKGIGAGRRSQICEWIAANLGHALEIPIPPFAIVEVPPDLIEIGGRPDLGQLGAGPAFGSARHPLIELSPSAVVQVPHAVQWSVLAFDWWLRNGDRTLTATGGNPNLFWDPAARNLLVFDHNQAFDTYFDPVDFRKLHAFSARIPELFDDIVRRDDFAKRLELALGRWKEIVDTIPPAWYFADPEMTIPADFDFTAAFNTLARCSEKDFWMIP
ncbi:HipA family kinase [uncultured Thiodictyon sp.]|jgi:hypothetical protein|uniref:HipA family kinase n=1 Tax=uncultured Thiodictyon sp. TaxID=1846217 RepID=UPI0025E33412|nr:HipA family kinase [uncultured Thiodictyon sp.]